MMKLWKIFIGKNRYYIQTVQFHQSYETLEEFIFMEKPILVISYDLLLF